MELAGEYYAKPKSAVVSETSKKTPQIVLTMDITHVADPSAENGWGELTVPIVRDLYLYLSEAAYPFTRKHLEMLGFNGNYTTPEFSCDGFSVVCKHEMYNGQAREKWGIGGGGAEPLEQTQVDLLQARWENEHPATVVTGAPPPAPAPSASPASAAPAAPTDDDIPF